ncbi:translational elongation factor EF-1 alpha [Mortierella sp. NVP41]|nr:translational elongation factor EF-1 alpha [Mortierella sp. NVP41]
MIVSHDSSFLDTVCTGIIHYESRKLKKYRGNLSKFVEQYPDAKSYYELKSSLVTFKLPEPGFLDGVKSKDKSLLRFANISFAYPGNTVPTIKNMSAQVSLNSRVAVIGPNGAGKSTLIKVLTGETIPQVGDVIKHPNLRAAYVAQHAFHHVEQHLTKTPNEYIRWRYQYGEDRELASKASRKISPEEEAQMKKLIQWEINGKMEKVQIEDLYGRRKAKRSFEYEVQFVGRTYEDNAWISREKLEEWGFEKIVQSFDDKEAARAGAWTRSLTAVEVEKHLGDLGLPAEFATHNHIKGLSGGQKVKVVLAAAMWLNPHILVLDEPTNYLDRDSLGALTEALREFGGGVVIISHHRDFTEAICTETWSINAGELAVTGNNYTQRAESKIVLKEAETKIDAFGNIEKVKSTRKLSRKELKDKQKRRAAAKARGEEVSDSEDEIYDIGSARLKYIEGFWTNPKTHEIQSKPAQAWTEDNMVHVEPLYYTLACSLSLQNCAFFLLQAFWSYISKSVTKSSFMSSFEFKVYVVGSCGALVVFPTVQYLFRNDFVYREVVPHLIFCILLFTTGVLGLRVHFRLVALIKSASEMLNETTLNVLEKLEYFKDMNVILTFSVFACAFSLGIVAGDGISPNPKIAGNKLASDLLITNLNFFQVIIWYSGVSAALGSSGAASGKHPGHNNNNNNNDNNLYYSSNNNNNKHHRRGPSDHFRPARRNEVQSEDSIQSHSKAELAENEVLDPYWAREEPQPHQHNYNQHHKRNFSHDSRNDTAITLTPLSPPPPALTIVTSGGPMSPTSITAPSLRGTTSPTSPTAGGSGKPGTETRTLYYHEALVKAQQQQQQDQANEYYAMNLADSHPADYNNSNKSSSLPQRTFSQGSSHYSVNTGRPERSANRPNGHGRNTPSIDYHHRANTAAGRNTPSTEQYRANAGSRAGGATSPYPSSPVDQRPTTRSGSSMDYRTPREYPSITHQASTAAAVPPTTRSLNTVTAHQEMMMMADPRTVDPRTVSALGQRHDSFESDRDVIHIAYMGSKSQAQLEDRMSSQGSAFYDGLSSSQLSRPYSPR